MEEHFHNKLELFANKDDSEHTHSTHFPHICLFYFYDRFPRRVIGKSGAMKTRFEMVKKFLSADGLTYTRKRKCFHHKSFQHDNETNFSQLTSICSQ